MTPKLINCPKCGALFIQKQRDICDDCFAKQMDLIDQIIKYVESSPLEEVHVKTIMEHFNISINELEHFITSLKLGAIEKKLVVNCVKCNDIMHINSSFSQVCKKCANEIKKDVLKHLY